MSNVVSFGDVIPGFHRPQESIEDLVVEYDAWVRGEQDGHDQVISAFRDKAKIRANHAHQFAMRFLDPKFVCEHDQCDCTQKHSVLAQLEGRLVEARGRRREYERLEQVLEQQIDRINGITCHS